MKSVLSGLYHGTLNPQDMFFHDEAFRELRRAFSEQENALSHALTSEQAEHLGKLLDKHGDMLLYEVETNFQTGFCLGLLLMLEVFQIMDTRFSWNE